MRASIGAPGCLYTGTESEPDCPAPLRAGKKMVATLQASSKAQFPAVVVCLSGFILPPAHNATPQGTHSGTNHPTISLSHRFHRAPYPKCKVFTESQGVSHSFSIAAVPILIHR